MALGNYKCSTLQQAIDQITLLGLLTGDVDPPEAKSDPSNYLVLFQDPFAGASVFVGSSVSFFVDTLDTQCP